MFSENSFEIVLMSRVYRQMNTSCDGGGLVFDEIQRIYRARKSYELYIWAKKWAYMSEKFYVLIKGPENRNSTDDCE